MTIPQIPFHSQNEYFEIHIRISTILICLITAVGHRIYRKHLQA